MFFVSHNGGALFCNADSCFFIECNMFRGLAQRVFLIGIGGISMSALAVFLSSRGHIVAGSDEVLSHITKRLEGFGITVFEKHHAQNVNDFDCVVYNAAISQDNEELAEARRLGKIVLSRAQLLGIVSQSFKTTIAIAGSHGKTTTTAMVSAIMLDAGQKPSIHLGGEYEKIQGNFFIGDDNIFITEACEYKDSFLGIKSDISVILNMQPDHLDYFGTFENMLSSFKKFSANCAGGVVVVNGDDENAYCFEDNNKKIYYSCEKKADYEARRISSNSNGCFSFDCIEHGKFFGRFHLSVRGRHNVYNALASIAIARQFGINFYQISRSLYEFYGVGRRFEQVGFINGASVIHDYAHHPTEIKSNISLAKVITKGKVICIFQPHTYSRTRDLFEGFVSSLALADIVGLYPIYPAREDPILGITSEKLSSVIGESGTPSVHLKNFDECFDFISKNAAIGDTVLILGAGNIVDLCKYFQK